MARLTRPRFVIVVLVVGAVAVVLVMTSRPLGDGGRGDDEQEPLPTTSPTPRADAPTAMGGRPDDGVRTGGARVGTPEGYGASVTGGLGGREYWVTSLADSGPGTLRAAAESSEPLWIRFRVSGTITLHDRIEVGPNKTIDGRGQRIEMAVDRDVTGLFFGSSGTNVIVHNLVFVGGEAARPSDIEPRENAIEINRGSQIWIDHNSLTGWGDKLIDMPDATDVTVSWNLFHDMGPGHAILIGTKATAARQDDTRVTIHHNVFVDIPDRSPRVQFGARAHVYNNYVENWTWYGMAAVTDAHLLSQGNVFAPGRRSLRAIINNSGSGGRGRVRSLCDVALDDATEIAEHDSSQVFSPTYSVAVHAPGPELADFVMAQAGWSGDPGAPLDEEPVPAASECQIS